MRSFPSEIRRSDRSTIEARLIPYNLRTEVTDMTSDGLDTYVEEVAPSTFAAQVRAAHPQTLARILFRDGHPQYGVGTKMGWATALRSDDTWLYGTFKVLPSRIADVVAMLDAGISDVSVGFVPLKTTVRADGTRVRMRGHLDHVALEPEGAYAGAEVLAMRNRILEAADEAAEQEQNRLDRSELDAWLKAEEARQAQFKTRLG